MLHQAIGRVRRLGQKSVVKVYEYHLANSFNIKHLSRNVSKVLPALTIQINNAEWNLQLDKDNKNNIQITLENTWVRNKDSSNFTSINPSVNISRLVIFSTQRIC
jgi:hypothetical protein